jgi:hypothetical protein
MSTTTTMATIATTTAYLSNEWRGIVNVWRHELLQCAWCGQMFNEMNNIGRWQCQQHRQPEPSLTTGTWRCCGLHLENMSSVRHLVSSSVHPDTSGCVRADHRESRTPWSPLDTVPLPVVLLREAAPLEAAELKDANDVVRLIGPSLPAPASTRFVARYDWRADEQAGYSRLLRGGK